MESNFQQIHDAIAKHLPKKWKRYIMYFAKSGTMFEFKYYVDEKKGFVACDKLKGYDDNAFILLSIDINEILSSERNALPKDKQWSVFTMTVAKPGKFNVEYFYDDISQTYITFRQEWEAKHIQ